MSHGVTDCDEIWDTYELTRFERISFIPRPPDVSSASPASSSSNAGSGCVNPLEGDSETATDDKGKRHLGLRNNMSHRGNG